MNTDAFPLDFGSLKKGDVISQEQIESIYNMRFTDDQNRYRFNVMQLGSLIERERPGELLVRAEGLTLRIMGDKEADAVTHKRIVQAVGSIGRNAVRRAAIDRSEFSGEERKTAESRDVFATAIAISTKKQLQKARRDKLLLGEPEETDSEPRALDNPDNQGEQPGDDEE